MTNIERVGNQQSVRMQLSSDGSASQSDIQNLITQAKIEFGSNLNNFEFRVKTEMQGGVRHNYLELRKQSNFGAFREAIGSRKNDRAQERKDALAVLANTYGKDLIGEFPAVKVLAMSSQGYSGRSFDQVDRNAARTLVERSALMAPETSFIRGGLKAFVPGGVLPNGKAFSFVEIPGSKTRAASPVIELGGRKIVIANIGGTKVPFYLSTGMAGKDVLPEKDRVPAGKWYPIFGVGEDRWLNKGSLSDMTSFQKSESLKHVAKFLDNNLGDIRNLNSIPKAETRLYLFGVVGQKVQTIVDKKVIEFINLEQRPHKYPKNPTLKDEMETIESKLHQLEMMYKIEGAQYFKDKYFGEIEKIAITGLNQFFGSIDLGTIDDIEKRKRVIAHGAAFMNLNSQYYLDLVNAIIDRGEFPFSTFTDFIGTYLRDIAKAEFDIDYLEINTAKQPSEIQSGNESQQISISDLIQEEIK